MGEEKENAEESRVVDISLKDLSKKLEEFARARDWEKYHSPRNLLLAMVIIIIKPISSSGIQLKTMSTLFHTCMSTVYPCLSLHNARLFQSPDHS